MNCRDHGPWLELEPFPSNPSLAPPQASKGPQLPVSTSTDSREHKIQPFLESKDEKEI